VIKHNFNNNGVILLKSLHDNWSPFITHLPIIQTWILNIHCYYNLVFHNFS
jgi:hypothetical protein